MSKLSLLTVLLLLVLSSCAPRPTVLVNLPKSVDDFRAPFDVVVIVTNDTDETISFDGTVLLYGDGWNQEVYPAEASEGTEIYWFSGNAATSSMQFSWRGDIQPHEAGILMIPTFSGPNIGTFPFVRVDMKVGKKEFQINKYITVTP